MGNATSGRSPVPGPLRFSIHPAAPRNRPADSAPFFTFMDIAIVTGAETPLGLRISQRLVRLGCRVHGIGNNFSNVDDDDPAFVAHAVDLTDTSAVSEAFGAILEREQALHVLVHAVDVTPGAPFENLSLGNLEAVLRVGLLGPALLTRMAFPNLLRFRGQIVNVVPTNKTGHAASAANSLIEGAFRGMTAALFDRARDAGLRLTNLYLRQNEDSAEAPEAPVRQRVIDPDPVADVVERLLRQEDPNIPSEIVFRPRSSDEAKELPDLPLPPDPYREVSLPPKGQQPREETPIPTQPKEKVHRTVPYTDGELEDIIAEYIEHYDLHPELYDSGGPAKPADEAQAPRHKDSEQRSKSSGESDDGAGKRRKRGRRRRKRGGETKDSSGESADESAGISASEAADADDPPADAQAVGEPGAAPTRPEAPEARPAAASEAAGSSAEASGSRKASARSSGARTKQKAKKAAKKTAAKSAGAETGASASAKKTATKTARKKTAGAKRSGSEAESAPAKKKRPAKQKAPAKTARQTSSASGEGDG